MLKSKKILLAILMTLLLAVLVLLIMEAMDKSAKTPVNGTKFVMLSDEPCVGAYLQLDPTYFKKTDDLTESVEVK